MGSNERAVEPEQLIEIEIDGRWWPGRLKAWQKESDGWYGKAVLSSIGHTNWYPSTRLRPRQ